MPLEANLAAPSAADICAPDDARTVNVPPAAEKRSAGCLTPTDVARAAAARLSEALALLQRCASA
jgi:hypothetical protein